MPGLDTKYDHVCIKDVIHHIPGEGKFGNNYGAPAVACILKDVFTNIIGNTIKHLMGPLAINTCRSSVYQKDREYC